MNILVIEDNQKHLEDAKRFFETQENIKVTYVSTYNDAESVMLKFNRETLKRVANKDIDGVISDIFFPLSDSEQYNQPEPIGVRVAVELSQRKVPFVLNTVGYHHGRKYEWINQFARAQQWSLVDTGSDYEKDANAKNWKKAYQDLLLNIKYKI